LACELCNLPDNESVMLLCDGCGTGWHTYCLQPPLATVPYGTWICPYCEARGLTIAEVDSKAAPELPTLGAPAPPKTVPRDVRHLHNLTVSKPVADSAGGDQALLKGVTTYMGSRAKVQRFLITYETGDTELLTRAELGARLPELVPSANATVIIRPSEPLPLTWPLGSEANLQAALHATCPVMACTAPPLSAAPAEGGAVPIDVYWPLRDNVNDWAFGRVLLPWGDDEHPTFRTSIPSTVANGVAPGGWDHPLKPRLYRTHAPSTVIMGGCPPEVLDLALGLAVRFSRLLVAAHVPATYVSGAHLGRFSWLSNLSKAGRVYVLRSVPGHLWLLIASSPGVFGRVLKASPAPSYWPW
jgi:hypothetical protein